ncbi:MAG: rhodanese-like domain-containing protein, partial [Anaerolineaceae bacterium]|nr:rhodanese-like domain-containing protein [Anaerolineaceae bacterium]
VELQISALPNAIHIPAEQLMERLGDLDRERALVVFCRNGTRSRRALHQLKAAGFTQVQNLTGGINAWVREVDPTLFEY